MKDIDELLRQSRPTPGRPLSSTFTSAVITLIKARLAKPGLARSLQELYMKLIHLPKIAVAALALVMLGAVGTGIYMTSQRTPSVSNIADKVGDKTTKGPHTNGQTEDGDLNVIDTNDILQEEAPPASAESGSASVNLDATDDQGRTYQLQGVGHDFQIDTRDGKSLESIQLTLATKGMSLSECNVTHKFVPDESGATAQIKTLPAVAKQRLDVYDGVHLIKATCTSKGKTLTAGLDFRVADHLAKRCKTFAFSDSPDTADSFEGLKAGMVGKWEGCVYTSWMPAYYVKMQFNADGTYSGWSDEFLDGAETNAMYYGMEQDSPEKRYSLNDFQASKTGIGEIDIVFDPGNTNRGTLKNLKLMGDKLSFDFYHRNEGSALTFQLYKK